MAGTGFHFDNKGIGKFLREGRLQVPPNQRSYAWREKHIRNLLQDLNESVTKSDSGEYFLGTIVLIQKGSDTPSIVDGQQRLATTTILLARIRDQFLRLKREGTARSIEESFLSNIDRSTELEVPRIHLNLEDNEYFIKKILPRLAMDESPESGMKASNRRLRRASEIANEFVSDIVKHLSTDAQSALLLRWVDFIEHNTGVLLVTVPDDVGAFRMFETLNDRGLKASQADILKNYFFSRSGKRFGEAQMMWSVIVNTIESSTDTEREYDDEGDIDKNDHLVTYLRHLWITTHGPTKARDLADAIKGEINNEVKTMQFLQEGSEAAQDYVALWSSRNPKWTKYKPTTKQHIETIAEHLRVEQIRPLLFAIARHFTPDEADKAFRLAVSWSVRFLIFGGRGGMLDLQYSLRAKEVGTKQITKASELRDVMKKYVPTDAEFEEAFTGARISRSWFARYLLRALEKTFKGIPHPEYVANDEVSDINLEHILPVNPGADWSVDDDTAQAAQKLLGNMVLLRANENRDVGNKGFDQKSAVCAKSTYDLTKQIAKYATWTLNDIRNRQRQMAKLAVKTWPVE
jgi:hypothetical protein